MNPNRKLSWSQIVLIFVGMFVYAGVKEVVKSTVADNAPGQFDLTVVARSVDEKCPMKIDQATVMTSCEKGAGNQLIYNYTLTLPEFSEVDEDEFRRLLRPSLVESLKGNKSMQVFCKHGVTMVYMYRDKDGAPVGRIAIPPGDYKQE